MLLSKIEGEFEELNKIIGDRKLFDSYKEILAKREVSRDRLLKWGVELRYLSKAEVILSNKKFESKIVRDYAVIYLNSVGNLFYQYDRLIGIMPWEEQESIKRDIADSVVALCMAIELLKENIFKIKTASFVVSRIIKETWEPLPDDKEEDNVNNIIVSSETRSMSLNDVSTDVNNLDRFFNSMCSLIGKDENNNIYLRKVETGSLTIAVSCVMAITPIIGFMFWCIKLCQDAAEKSWDIKAKRLNNEEKRLDIEEKRLKIINDKMHMAKEILEIEPDNKEADEIIQRCAIHIWDFLENNPTGTINGEHYDIGIEKPKIEDKEKKSN